MCKIVEEIVNEAREEARREVAEECARKMLATGKYSLEEIMDIVCLSLADIEKLQEEKRD